MSAPYRVALRELIGDAAVVEELDRLAAVLARQIEPGAEKGLDTGQLIKTTAATDAGGSVSEPGVRWSQGPWLIKPSGVVTASQIAANQDNYAPNGLSGVSQVLFDNALIVEVASDQTGRQITGLSAKWSDYQFLFLLNIGSFPITLKHQNGGSYTNNQFTFPNSLDYTLYPNVLTGFVWRATSRGSKSWYPMAADGIGVLPGVSSFTPHWATRNWWGGRAEGTVSVGFVTIGGGVGTLTAVGTAALNNQADSTYNQYTTPAVADTEAGVRAQTTTHGVQLRHGPTFLAKIRTGASIAAIRFWIGLTRTAPTSVDNLGGTAQYVMFRYSTVAGDGGWVGTARDGTTQSVTATVASIAANTAYLLKIRLSSDGATAYFSVDGGTEISLATNLPAGTTTLAFAICCFTTAAAAKSINISRYFCEFGT